MSARTLEPDRAADGRPVEIDKQRLIKFLELMERILILEEQEIRSIDALEMRLVKIGREDEASDERARIEKQLGDLRARLDTLQGSFARIDDYLKRNGF